MFKKLWHDRYEQDWMRAFPLGNGRIGAMVYGGPDKEILQLNEESLWSGRKIHEEYDNTPESLQQIRQYLFDYKIAEAFDLCEKHMLTNPKMVRFFETFGEIHLEFDDQSVWTDYRKELDLDEAIAWVSYRKGDAQYRSETLISQAQDVLAYRLQADKAFGCSVTVNRLKDVTTRAEDHETLRMDGQLTYEDNEYRGPGGKGLSFGARLKVLTDGVATADGDKIRIEKATYVTVFAALATNYNIKESDVDESICFEQKLHDQVDEAVKLGFDKILQEHIQDHQAGYDKAELSIDCEDRDHIPTDVRLAQMREGAEDPGLVCLYFHFGRYLLQACSGKNATLPANLQGLWCNELTPPWSSDYHCNINLQMNYWPTGCCNLPQTLLPLFDFVERNSHFGAESAKRLYFTEGWTVHHTVDIFGRTGVHDGIQWGVFPMAGPWLCLNLWEHYEYTGDREYLEKLYPVMLGSSKFIADFLIEDGKGNLVTNPSTSPENRYFFTDSQGNKCDSMFTYGATVDFEISYAILSRMVYACRLLGRDEDQAQRFEAILKRLPPLRISQRYGTVCEWIEDFEETEPEHRHISHMFALYPSDQINEESGELFQAAKNTIARRLAHGGGAQGWSRAWIVNFYGRLKDQENAHHHLKHLVCNSTADNLLDMHPPFQIDGNFGGISGIAEMLLQSQLGKPGERVLDLLPALPEAWKSGSVRGLGARGGITVDLSWRDGVVTALTVHSEKPSTLRLKWNDRLAGEALPEGGSLRNGILTVPVCGTLTIV